MTDLVVMFDGVVSTVTVLRDRDVAAVMGDALKRGATRVRAVPRAGGRRPPEPPGTAGAVRLRRAA